MTDERVARHRIDSAQKAVQDVAQKRAEEAMENRRSLENFYRNLALLSGGTIALSITYLGFLKTVTSQPLHPNWLIVSWGLLFICLVCATYYTFFAASYNHYARSREWAERLKERKETIAEELPNVPIIGIQTKADQDEYIKELRAEAAKASEGAEWHKRREKIHEFLFRACGLTARVTLVLGIAGLLLFAIANLNLSSRGASSSDKPQKPVQTAQ